MKTCVYDLQPPIGVVPPRALICACHRADFSEAEPISSHFYRCRHCGELELKEKWGPGRITCPSCGRVAPSAEESRDMAMCPVCGGPSVSIDSAYDSFCIHGRHDCDECREGLRQLLCRPCTDKRGDGPNPPMPFLDFTFCDQPCQSYHKEGEHLLP